MLIKRLARFLGLSENLVAFLALSLLALVPAAEVVARLLTRGGIPASHEYVIHLVLWVTFLGGMITSREERHLSMSVGLDLLGGRVRAAVRIVNAAISTTIALALAWASLSMILLAFDPGQRVGVVPIRIATCIMPIGYAVMAGRFIWAVRDLRYWPISLLGIVLGSFLGIQPMADLLQNTLAAPPGFLQTWQNIFYAASGVASLPVILILILSAFAGAPLFIVLGGIAYMLFAHSGGALAVIPNEAYSLLTGNSIAAIPLFTLAGFMLSEGSAGKRLVRLFRAWFGWIPGGLIIMAVLVCAFFTTFTGASGVTILALGGLLSFVLSERGVGKAFGNGMLTAAGSVGLLFPPSLPVILYGVVAEVNIKNMFLAGIVPGLVMVVMLCAIGVIYAVRSGIKVVNFRIREALSAFVGSIWELLLPVVVLASYFGGLTTLEETGAIAVVYVAIVELAVTRDLKLRDLAPIMLKCLPIIGGVLVILAVAKGLSYYIVDAQIPVQLTAWIHLHVHSRYVFLLLLNLALLVVGMLMDIYSAILVVVPLILPLGELFRINPLHLGIIFLANMELGFLTPPVGLNLFIASYRFEQPLMVVSRNVFPFLMALLASVLVITYVPWFSTGLVRLLGAGG